MRRISWSVQPKNSARFSGRIFRRVWTLRFFLLKNRDQKFHILRRIPENDELPDGFFRSLVLVLYMFLLPCSGSKHTSLSAFCKRWKKKWRNLFSDFYFAGNENVWSVFYRSDFRRDRRIFMVFWRVWALIFSWFSLELGKRLGFLDDHFQESFAKRKNCSIVQVRAVFEDCSKTMYQESR